MSIKYDSPVKSKSGKESTMDSTDINNGMLSAKCNRKRAEVDVQLLANRVALLRQEESKALQKISVTKERANDIITIKKRNECSGTDKQSQRIMRETEKREMREHAQDERKKREERLRVSRELVLKNKSEIAKHQKQQMEVYLQGLQRHKIVHEVEKKKKANEQRRKHELFRKQREQEKLDKEMKIQAEYAKRLEEENIRAEEAEALFIKLEMEEKELINRLRETQSKQNEAYMTLKASIDA